MRLLLCVLCGAAFVCCGGVTDISRVDSNFRTATVGNTKVEYRDVRVKPFDVSGFAWRNADGKFYRLPETLTNKEINKGALYLANHTSGGMVRFRTDSPKIALRVKLKNSSDMNHMPRSGSSGFDFYERLGEKTYKYVSTVQPMRVNLDGKVLEQLPVNGRAPHEREWVIYMPLYNGVESMEIGLIPGASLREASPLKVKSPVVFYGSSITQGGCASRPGNNYTSMLCRAVDAPQVNLGFSGSGKGEIALAREIAGLKMSAFVLDYDYNAPNAKHLADTHEPFFRAIREKQPELPVIFLSRCSHAEDARRDVIKKTYDNAVARGDKKVWFIDGASLFLPAGRDLCTVDDCHPNDLGFYMMYSNVLPLLREALK